MMKKHFKKLVSLVLSLIMNKANASKTDAVSIVNTTIGNAEFITPIDMNPYSYTTN